MQLHHDILNPARIVTLNHLENVISNRLYREVGASGVRLTPPVEPRVCLHFDETARAVAETCHKRFNGCNFHRVPPLTNLRSTLFFLPCDYHGCVRNGEAGNPSLFTRLGSAL